MEWYWYLIVNICVFSLATLYQRVVLKNSPDPVVYSVVNGLIGGAILLGYGFYVGFKIPDISNISVNLILMAVLLGFGNMLTFSGLKRIEASEFTVLFSTRAIWSVVAAV